MSTDWYLPKIKQFRVTVMISERTREYKEYGVYALNEKEARKIVKKELRKEITRRLNAMRIEEVSSEPDIPVSGAV